MSCHALLYRRCRFLSMISGLEPVYGQVTTDDYMRPIRLPAFVHPVRATARHRYLREAFRQVAWAHPGVADTPVVSWYGCRRACT
jgi:hypothetical protein